MKESIEREIIIEISMHKLKVFRKNNFFLNLLKKK